MAGREEFFPWRSQPQEIVRPDPNCSLLRGGQDGLLRLWSPVNGGIPIVGIDGLRAAQFTASGGGEVKIPLDATSFDQDVGITIAMVVRSPFNSSDSTSTIRQPVALGDSTGLSSLAFNWTHSNSGFRAAWQTNSGTSGSSTWVANLYGSGVAANTWHFLSASVQRGASKFRIFRSGMPAGVVTASAVKNVSLDPFLYVGSGQNASGFTSGHLALAVLVGRAWSDAEHAAWGTAPWQVWEPQRIWIAVSEGTPPGEDGSAPGATAITTLTMQAGAASASSGAPGASTTAEVSMLPGTATGGASASAPGALVSIGVTMAPGAPSGDASAPGTTRTVTVSMLPGAATGGASASAPGATVLSAISMLPGAPGASSQAPGAAMQILLSMLPGAASSTGGGNAPGALVGINVSMQRGLPSAGAQAPAGFVPIHATWIPGYASGNSDLPPGALAFNAQDFFQLTAHMTGSN